METKRKLGSYKQEKIEQRREMERDLKWFFILLGCSMTFLIFLLVFGKWAMEKIDQNTHIFWLFVGSDLITVLAIKLIVGRRKMW